MVKFVQSMISFARSHAITQGKNGVVFYILSLISRFFFVAGRLLRVIDMIEHNWATNFIETATEWLHSHTHTHARKIPISCVYHTEETLIDIESKRLIHGADKSIPYWPFGLLHWKLWQIQFIFEYAICLDNSLDVGYRVRLTLGIVWLIYHILPIEHRMWKHKNCDSNEYSGNGWR